VPSSGDPCWNSIIDICNAARAATRAEAACNFRKLAVVTLERWHLPSMQANRTIKHIDATRYRIRVRVGRIAPIAIMRLLCHQN